TRLVETGRFEARTNAPVQAIRRLPDGVLVHAGGRTESFDQVVLAAPADRALAMLGAGASKLERDLLGAIRYQPNRAVVHSDPALLPKRRRVWASWNYMAADGQSGSDRVSVSYWINRLQNLALPEPIVVSLNPNREPAADRSFAEFVYRHPQFDQAAIDAQALMPAIQGVNRTWFAGSYCGYGFHEDAVESGLSVAGALGAPAPWAGEVSRRTPPVPMAEEPQMVAA
ncbi:MAG: NAD/FAD-binding protein, partial [Alphaproteobacteria bacterium]|nr:NAD/FAD-binding protein [Alphaproteobacteria bacterium]